MTQFEIKRFMYIEKLAYLYDVNGNKYKINKTISNYIDNYIKNIMVLLIIM